MIKDGNDHFKNIKNHAMRIWKMHRYFIESKPTKLSYMDLGMYLEVGTHQTSYLRIHVLGKKWLYFYILIN